MTWNQGWWKEAEALQVLVAEMMKWVLSKEHPHLLTSMANLALTYGSQDRWKEAEELQVMVMEVRKQEHHHSLTNMAS